MLKKNRNYTEEEVAMRLFERDLDLVVFRNYRYGDNQKLSNEKKFLILLRLVKHIVDTGWEKRPQTTGGNNGGI